MLTCAYIDDVITFLGFSIDFDDDDDDDTDLFSESKKKNPVAAAAAVAAPPPATLPSFSAVPPPAAVRERHASQLTPAADGGSWEASDVTRNLVLWCFDALHGLEARKRGHCTSKQVVSVFRGTVPLSSGTPPLDPELKELALQSFRCVGNATPTGIQLARGDLIDGGCVRHQCPLDCRCLYLPLPLPPAILC